MSKKNEVVVVETPMVEVHGKTLFERVTNFLTAQDWNFDVVEDGRRLFFRLRLHDGTVQVLVDTLEADGWCRILAYCTYPTIVPASKRQAVADAAARINYATAFGNMEIDMGDGDLRARAVLEDEDYIGEAMIERAVRRCVELADQYQAPLLAIAFGNASPSDVLAMASRGEDATLQ